MTAVLALQVSYPPVPSVLGLSPHGLLTAAGIAAGGWFLRRQLMRRGVDPSPFETAVLCGVLAAIIGARVDYVLSHLGDFTADPVSALRIWQGGLALVGGLLAGVVTAALLVRRAGFAVLPSLDLVAPGLPLAIAVGRIGDLLLTDHLGRPTTSSWALSYAIRPGSHLAPGFGDAPAAPPGAGSSCATAGSYFAGCSYHLTPAYDIVGALVLLAVLLAVRSRLADRPGATFSLFTLLYGVQRLTLDRFRGIDERLLAGLSGTQLVAIIAVLLSAVTLVILRFRRPTSAEGSALLIRAPVTPAHPAAKYDNA